MYYFVNKIKHSNGLNNTTTYNKIDKPYFENLYGLRLYGALAVFIFHAFSLFRENWVGLEGNNTYQIILKITRKGSLGVNLFFVLSGFLITYLLLWEKSKFGKVNALQFIKRRTLRIWPVYFLVVLFGFFIFPMLPYGKEVIYDLGYYLGFLSNINEIQIGLRDSVNFMTPPWSVSVEEQFYIVLALLLGLFSFVNSKKLIWFYVAVILASLIFRYFNLENERVIYFHTFSVMSDIAVGGILAILAFSKSILPFFQNLSKLKIVFIYILGFALILFKNLVFTGQLQMIERLVLSLFFGFIILEQVYSNHSIFKVDSIKMVKKGGEISYGFYMYHVIVMYFVSNLFNSFGIYAITDFVFLYLPLALILNTILAYISFRWFEQFFLRFK